MSRMYRKSLRNYSSQQNNNGEEGTSQRRTRGRTTQSQTNQSSLYDEPSTSQGRGRRKEMDIDLTLYEDDENSQHNIDSQSQRSQKSQWAKLTDDEEIHLANKVIRYMLAMDRKKQVIQKTHITKQVLQDNSKSYQRIIARVKERLSKVLGYKLVELEGNKFILINELENTTPHLSFPEEDRKQQVLLFIVLTHIFMCNNSCRERDLWDFLQRLDILRENESEHEYFGDVKSLICNTFVTQQYLERTIEDKDEDSSRYVFRWGNRATHELPARRVLEFMSTVYGGKRMDTWPQQFKAMQKLEKEMAKEDTADDD